MSMTVFTEGWAMMIPWGRIESNVYWLTFVAGFIVVAIWESRRPQRNLSSAVTRRWSRHGIILYANMLVSVGLYRASPVIVAVAMSHSRFGLLNEPWLAFPVRFIVALLLLDLARYAVHWSYHAVPFLWRFHYVHHSDPDFDLSSGVRAHPIEVALTQGSNLAAVAILAAPPAAVLAAELFSCAQGFFSHANASLPGWLEKPVRWMFVTPDMHRVHHSEEVQEQSRNLGEIFPWWDHLFKTYLKAPAAGQDQMLFGIKGIQNDESLKLTFMLFHPFRHQAEEIAMQETPVTQHD
jgi:sterol desaturase/sphingolipid hydroxylase (fatty acid hydroxylase superfamily)